METITQDFEFHKFSAQYGRFLIAVADMSPKSKISDVSFHYRWKDSDTIRVSVDVPHDIAMLLKLQFNQELVKRPPPTPRDGEYRPGKTAMMKMVKYRKTTPVKDYTFDIEGYNKIDEYNVKDTEMYNYLKEYSKNIDLEDWWK
jgi:hypothetical protein